MRPAFCKSGAQTLKACAALMLGLSIGSALAASADPLGEVQELLKSGRSAEALRTLDTLITQRPGDAQLRFQKGVILVDQKRSAEAIGVFQRLGQDFPALPEPFNNLAVLYVEQGQLDKARSALESAIRSRPNYGTAFQNLGDVYTRMASRAYARALQIEDPEATPKLALIRDLYDMPAPTTVAALTPPAPGTKPGLPATAASAAPVLATTPAPAPVAAPVAAPATTATTAQAATAASAAAASPAAPRANDDTRAVTAAVNGWADAWSRKDMNDYIGAYVRDFKGSDESAAAWQSNRRERIMSKRRISVAVSGLKIDIVKDVARVSFRQSYSADLLRVASQKTLELEHRNGKWLIRKESTGS